MGKVLTLSGLQFCVDASVTRQARKAGVRQRVEFPRLEGSFSLGQPVFLATGAAIKGNELDFPSHRQ